MDLTTLTPTFLAATPVDEFISAVWTERYAEAGEAQIVLGASKRNIDLFREGTYLALRGSREVVQIESQSIEDGKLTVIGPTLERAILGQRYVWAANPDYDGSGDNLVADYSREDKKPGDFISHVVDKFVINPVDFTGTWTPAKLDAEHDKIYELFLGATDASGTVQRLTAPTGPVYTAIEQLAKQHQVGISLYVASASPLTGFRLEFTTYKGQDRTSDQSTNPLVRLSPELDGISDIKELRSISQWKNVVYVYYQGSVTKFLADPSQPEPEGLDRRVMVTDAQGEPPGHKENVISGVKYPGNEFGGPTYNYTQVTVSDVPAFLAQNAKDALANNNYIHSIDGKTSPISDYTFGRDYFLGDIIELEGLTGDISKAQITEFIRSVDKNGEKSYPTISVVK